MLILDKQKAVERIVALTSAGAEAEPEQQAAAPAERGGQRLASYERAPVAAAPTGTGTTTRRRERRRRRRLATTNEPAPA